MIKRVQGKRYMLVIVDRFSCWVEAVPSADEGAGTVIKFLTREVFPRFGIPSEISSDNGSAFIQKTEKRKELCDETETSCPITPGDQVYLRVFRRKWNEPRREGPYKVTAATSTAVQVEGSNTWYHLNHCTRVPKDKIKTGEDRQETSEQVNPEAENNGGTINNTTPAPITQTPYHTSLPSTFQPATKLNNYTDTTEPGSYGKQRRDTEKMYDMYEDNAKLDVLWEKAQSNQWYEWATFTATELKKKDCLFCTKTPKKDHDIQIFFPLVSPSPPSPKRSCVFLHPSKLCPAGTARGFFGSRTRSKPMCDVYSTRQICSDAWGNLAEQVDNHLL
ncbi:hypothetical protein QQF64_006683 [Cirrhinus molitorella]|uniref:Integrase catalytic domain-containing protein n=1 Tax=Cirrhinus molitorella TaxID=172907 RepID=A0ABR3M8H7_9TELE